MGGGGKPRFHATPSLTRFCDQRISSISWAYMRTYLVYSSLACEQALLFGRAKRVARERASVYFSRYPPHGELARRLTLAIFCSCRNAAMGIRWKFFWDRSNNYIPGTFSCSRHYIPLETSNERIRLLIYRSSFTTLSWQKPWRLSWHLSRYCRHSSFFRRAPDALQHLLVKRRLPWPTSVHCLMTLQSVRHSRKTPGPEKGRNI